MNSKVAVIGIVALTTLACATNAAFAMPSSQWVQNYCDRLGGIFYGANGNNVYGCLMDDKTLVCGGGDNCRWYKDNNYKGKR
jgi:hypothetical protein